MKILSIGAIIWDIIDGREYIGGAPFNLAVHLSRMGEDTAMMARLGRDERGARAFEILKNEGLKTGFVQWDDTLPTGTAKVSFSEDGEPHYDLPRSSYDAMCVNDAILNACDAFGPDCVCYGTIEQRYEETRWAQQRTLDHINARHMFFDVNIRMNFVDKAVIEHGCRKATILKLNEEESVILSRLLLNGEIGSEAFCRRMADQYSLETVIVTYGAKGCCVLNGGRYAFVPARPVECVDSVGAGDAFSAGFLHGLSTGLDPFKAAELGNASGGYVASHRSALPAYDDAFIKMIRM